MEVSKEGWQSKLVGSHQFVGALFGSTQSWGTGVLVRLKAAAQFDSKHEFFLGH